MIDIICQYPAEIVLGISALSGALINAGLTIYNKRKIDKEYKFQFEKIVDTIWQSTLVGASSSIAIGCGWYGIVIAMLSGIGIDKITNKLKIQEKDLFNFVKQIIRFLSK